MFYFPGCGSERLFSQVGLATQAMLWHAGVQTVLPPGYLCCGYPQRGSGQFDKAEKIITDNRVRLDRVANTLNYLDIKTVVVSCGTCYDQLQGYQFDKIFPGCRIIDIHEYLLEKGMTLGNSLSAKANVSEANVEQGGLKPKGNDPGQFPFGEGKRERSERLQARRPKPRGHHPWWAVGRRLPLSRPLPHADEAAGADEDGEGAGSARMSSRASAVAAKAGRWA